MQQGSICKKNSVFSLHHMTLSWQSLNHIFIINGTLRTHSSTVMLKFSISRPMSSQHAATISQTLFSDSMFFIDTSICYPLQNLVNGPPNRQNSCILYHTKVAHQSRACSGKQLGWRTQERPYAAC